MSTELQGFKSELSSMTIQGSIVGILPAVYAMLKAFGFDLPDGSFEAIINGVTAAMAVVTVVMTYFGRKRAETKIG